MDFEIIELGESALCIRFKQLIPDIAVQRRLWGLANDITQLFEEKIELIFGMNSLSIVYSPFLFSKPQLIEILNKLLENETNFSFKSNLIEVPVSYGNEHGPDLLELAAYTNLSPQDVIKKHTETLYTVYFLGFQPGFAFMGGLDQTLHMPRKSSPRLEVPAGSVGIGGAQTGIYPSKAPGGWQLIGQTALVLFDPSKQQRPSLFQPGDQIKFIDINANTIKDTTIKGGAL